MYAHWDAAFTACQAWQSLNTHLTASKTSQDWDCMQAVRFKVKLQPPSHKLPRHSYLLVAKADVLRLEDFSVGRFAADDDI